MRYITAMICAVLVACLVLTGCSSNNVYISVTPHAEQPAGELSDSIEVSSFTQIKQALSDVVAIGAKECIMYLQDLDRQVADFYMISAIRQIISNDPMGAYAVNEITYEMGTNAGREAVAVNIAYKHGRGEILRIKKASVMSDVEQIIATALENRSELVAVLIQNYEQMDLEAYAVKYAADHPDIIMELPQITSGTYPATGEARVLEVVFTYRTSRDELQRMADSVAPVFTSAELYVNSDSAEMTKAEQLYSFLMKRFDYTLDTSVTPTYSLLQDGIGDSKAFACVYAHMCRSAGITCWAIKGEYLGQERWWNGFLLEDGYYYVDLLRSSNYGDLMIMTDRQMGGYSWNRQLFAPLETK